MLRKHGTLAFLLRACCLRSVSGRLFFFLEFWEGMDVYIVWMQKRSVLEKLLIVAHNVLAICSKSILELHYPAYLCQTLRKK